MAEFLYWFTGIFGYGIMSGVTFKVIANTATSNPDEPWETPGPFFGGLMWPLLLPAVVGIKMVGTAGNKESKTERKRKEEIAAAEHKKELARIAAEELAINERALSIK